MIGIEVNGEPLAVAAGTTVAALLRERALAQQWIAVEVNGAIIGRDDYEGCVIPPGAKVEIIHAVGGG